MDPHDTDYGRQSPICVLQYCDIKGYIYANHVTTALWNTEVNLAAV